MNQEGDKKTGIFNNRKIGLIKLDGVLQSFNFFLLWRACSRVDFLNPGTAPFKYMSAKH